MFTDGRTAPSHNTSVFFSKWAYKKAHKRHLPLPHSGQISREQTDVILLIFPRKYTTCIEFQSLFFGKSKRNISKRYLLKFLINMLSIKIGEL